MEKLLSPQLRPVVHQLLSRSYDSVGQAAADVARLVRTSLHADVVLVQGIRGSQVELLGVDDALGLGLQVGMRVPAAETFCDRVLRGEAPSVWADLVEGPFADLPVREWLGVRGYATTPLWDTAGWPTGTVCVYTREPREFTDDQLAVLEFAGALMSREQELARGRAREAARSAEVVASETRYRSLIDDLGDLVVETDAAGHFTYVNRAFTELTGVRLEDMAGWGLLDRVHPDDRPIAEAQVAAGLGGADTAGPETACEVRFLVPDGSTRWMSVRGRPVFDDAGDLVGLRGILHDVTVRVEAEQQVRAALAQAEAALADAETARDEAQRLSRAKSEFLSRMSHELRTPLNAILGFGQLLELGDLTGEDAENLGQIMRAGTHLLDLINEVLDVVRIESGRLSLSLEPVAVREVVAESLDLVRTAAAPRGISLRTPTRLDGAVVVADRQRLKQVLVNLLSNAVKYNRDGGDVTVAWGPSPDDPQRLRLAVTDTGQGIPADRLDDAFVPFDRLGAENSGIEGTGVGLSLTKTLVEAQSGVIGVLSEPGRGSTFWVDLPAAEPLVVPAAPVVDAVLTHTVLYVEDNPSNTTLVRKVLARRPHVHLEVVADGAEALPAAAAVRPDLVLLDLHLPGVPGEEVLARLRGSEDTRLAGVPVVVVTADLSPGIERRMLEAGATRFLSKPIDVRQLLAVVDEHLAGS
ncbi:ATP-binding protein [Geodermatophilus sp. DSM 44513]|uniref:ATP-binding protein n=1 Tax=Geodermatophilus sp. DSM 44513 TaxID=1528104 RepID=UPI00126EC52D|nr:ATP-binding protein [Geodermatophilus sp. DSM 44513]WNV75004.1 ATP-binding protein [Geodermatophilus sp. DSM 44513]